jgi:hypothetical protein
VVANVFESPLEGTHHAIVISLVMRQLAAVHERFPQNSELQIANMKSVILGRED